MAVHTAELRLATQGDADVIDITADVQRVVAEAPVDGRAGHGLRPRLDCGDHDDGVRAGWRGRPARPCSTGSIPVEGDYEHNRLNHDTNSHAHQRASLIGASEQVPVIGGRLALGTWQQLVLIDFDDRPRDRTVVVQVVF